MVRVKFGISLGVAYHKLKEFEKEVDPFAAVVDYWLRGNVEDAPRSWRTIVEVLEGKDIGERRLAEDINRKYCHQDNRANTVVTESAMEIGENDRESACTIDRVLRYVQDVKNVRAFGSVLKLDPGKLDEIDRDLTSSRINLIVKEWFRMEDMSDSDRWEKLGAALLEPAVHEPGIVSRLRPYLRRGSSVDSAISMMSSSLQYQMSYVDNIGKNKECSIQNVLNAIALYSEWYDIGLYLGLPTHELDFIKTSYLPADQKVHLVESWKRLDPGGFTWDRLCRALKQVVEAQLRKDSADICTDCGVSTPRALTHPAVKRFLKPLSNVEIRKLGLELGLRYPHLKNMKEDTLVDDMLDSWLREDDDVSETSGTPSWESLAKALEEAGYNGVALKIRKEIGASKK